MNKFSHVNYSKNVVFLIMLISISSMFSGHEAFAKPKEITIKVRNVSFPNKDPGETNLSSHKIRRERTIKVPVEESAIILIDI